MHGLFELVCIALAAIGCSLLEWLGLLPTEDDSS